MIVYTKNELNEILEAHKKWLAGVEGGVQANLSCADLRWIDLAGVNLSFANLRAANLSCARLKDANLSGANLRAADLDCANLSAANLAGADLSYANLSAANLAGADLSDINLMNSILIRTNMNSCLNVPFIPMACPEEGSFIGYKKSGDMIVKLEILSDAKRSSACSRKCRCDKARVIEIQTLSGDRANVNSIQSNHDKTFIYTVGEIVKVDNFDKNRFNECSTGIHFFINRQEAVDY